jgi:hypothetical protein
MQHNLTIFANFFIDTEERFIRMQDSLQSMRGIKANCFVVNVRGLYALQTINYLKNHIESLHIFSIESQLGWFYDTSKITYLVQTPYILLWIEDHICLAPEGVNSVVTDMVKTEAEILTYTFWQGGKFLQRYCSLDQTDAGSVTWFEHTLRNDHLVQKSKVGESYLISYASIISKNLLNKIISDGGTDQGWSIMTPYNFEKPPEDIRWLPLRRANPKIELFASIDDDHGENGSCLQARGLYPKRNKRQTYTKNNETWFNKVARRVLRPLKRLKAIIFLNVLRIRWEFRLNYLTSNTTIFNYSQMPLPRLNYDAIEYILPKLEKISTVFEYGSENSILFWAHHGKQVTSIEYDPSVYRKTSVKIAALYNIEYRLIEPELDASGSDTKPSSIDRCHSNYFKGYTFKKYVECINEYPNDYFDVVLVDGRSRPSCLVHSMVKVKPGGLLVLNNSNREYYLREVDQHLSHWAREIFFAPVPGALCREEAMFFTKPF